MKFPRSALLIAACTSLGACASVPGIAPSIAVPEQARAKNVILFIGDGMGISTVTAARIYDGQTRGEPGEENLLSFERFPNVALVKTYNTNQQVPDSAGTATAMNTGVKTRAGVINIGPETRRGDCAASREDALRPIADDMRAAGRSVGIVSTARLTHATPAAVYAHSPERDWENDSQIPADQRAGGCTDIAAQLVRYDFDVALGGGMAQFRGKAGQGYRTGDAVDLPAEWAARTGGHLVTTAAQMQAVPDDGRPLLGLFSPSHMTYMVERDASTAEPTLTQMTAAAIARLADDEDGYFLMVEGGRIDHGHHAGQAAYALAETQEFARAVQTALGMVDLKDTLILVTADHSHVFSIAGYPTRGNPILGVVEENDDHGEATGTPALASDDLPYTTLGYQNGPGAIAGQRTAPSTAIDARQQAAIPLGSETHGGEDVALYAIGPGAERARGVIEQSVVHDIMRDAAQ